MPAPPVTKRNRLTLRDRKAVVDRYLYFLTSPEFYVDPTVPRHYYDPYDGKENERYEKSIKMFLKIENLNWAEGHKLDMSNVFKWVKASDRGEYLEWGGRNDIDRPNCRSKIIIDHIDNLLSNAHHKSANWNELVKSPSSPDKYGVVARRDVPAGTFLGFYKGEHFITNDTVKGPDKYKIDGTNYVDASGEFTSCYARFYNWSTSENRQNVSVERLTEWTDPNKAICFIANRAIKRGAEFVIAHGQDMLGTSPYKRYKTAPSNFAHLAAAKAKAFDK